MVELDLDYGNTRTEVEYIMLFQEALYVERKLGAHHLPSKDHQLPQILDRKHKLIELYYQSFYNNHVLVLWIVLVDSKCASNHHIDDQYADHQFQLQLAKLTVRRGNLTIWHIMFLGK